MSDAGACTGLDYASRQVVWRNDLRRYVVDLRLTRDQILRMYQDRANAVVGRARNGQRVRFPMHSLRQFVGVDGVNDTFQLTVDGQHRLVSIERLSKPRPGA